MTGYKTLIAIAASATVAAPAGHAIDPSDPFPPPQVFTATFTQKYMNDDFCLGHYKHHLDQGIVERDGGYRACGFWAIYGRTIPEKYDVTSGGGAISCHSRYPALKPGDVLPINGRLYRVGPFGTSPEQTDPVVFTQVKNFAEGKITVQPDAFVVPLGAGTYSRIRDHTIQLLAIEQADAKTGGPIAKLEVDYPFPVHAKVRAGDVLVLPRVPRGFPVPAGDPGRQWFGFQVTAIVPPDATTGAIGWLELNPEPLTQEVVKTRGLAGRVVEAKSPDAKRR